MYLNEAQVGKNYTVEKITLPFETERRLEALGMTNRAPVSVLNRKGKGILIIKLRGTRFALGYNITKNIEVEESGDGVL
ncbi:MAG TPA: FeoA domain-containing protein [Candidatus Coproplasma stercoravium]|nr:FeoA domain-containing protein [Candidatus Coproplasma stercoravium]